MGNLYWKAPAPDEIRQRGPFNVRESIENAGTSPFVKVGEHITPQGQVAPKFIARSRLSPLLIGTLSKEQELRDKFYGRNNLVNNSDSRLSVTDFLQLGLLSILNNKVGGRE